MSSNKNLIVVFLKVFLISLFVVTFCTAFSSCKDPVKGESEIVERFDEEGKYLGKEERTYDGEKWVNSGIMDYHDIVNETNTDEEGHHVHIQTEKFKKYKWDDNKGEYVLIESTMNKVFYKADDSIQIEDYNWDNDKGEYVLATTKEIPATNKERKPTVMVNIHRVHSTEPATKDEIKDTKTGTSKAENTGGNTGGGGNGGGGGGGGGGGQP